MPDDGPKKNLGSTNVRDLVRLSDEERRCTRERYKVFLGNILREEFPAFDFLTGVVPTQTPCQYQAQMALQSVVVPMPVLMKDEKSTRIWLMYWTSWRFR